MSKIAADLATFRCPKIGGNTIKRTCLAGWQMANDLDKPNPSHPCFECDRGGTLKQKFDRTTQKARQKRNKKKSPDQPYYFDPPRPPILSHQPEDQKLHLDDTFRCKKKKKPVCFGVCITDYFKASAGNLKILPPNLKECHFCRLGAMHRRQYSENGFRGLLDD